MESSQEELALIDQLAQDPHGHNLRVMTDRLENERSEYKTMLTQNCGSPKEAEELSLIVRAYDAALGLLPKVWEQAQRPAAS